MRLTVFGARSWKSWNVNDWLSIATSLALAAWCDTVRVQYGPCATETWMSGLSELTV